MDAVLTEADLTELIRGLHAFVEREVLPLEAQHRSLLDDPRQVFDPVGGYSSAVRQLMARVRTASARAGYYGLFSPKSIGGPGLSYVAYYTIWSELFQHYGPGRLLPYQTVAHWTSGPGPLSARLSSELTGDLLNPLVTGTATTCFAMSEPDAGSDAWMMSTRASQVGGKWVLNGTKQWVTNAHHASFVFVFAVTDEKLRTQRKGGITCFAVPADTPGFAVDSAIRMFGHPGGDEAILSFTDVTVPATNIVGKLDEGFALALEGVSLGRMYNVARSVGLARWALRLGVEYARTRRTFGRQIFDHQGVSFQLADSAIDLHAAHALGLECARQLDLGESGAGMVSMSKVFATEACYRVIDRCMQVHGAMGLTNDVKLYDAWHQARAIRIADGSAELLRRNIARDLSRGRIVV